MDKLLNKTPKENLTPNKTINTPSVKSSQIVIEPTNKSIFPTFSKSTIKPLHSLSQRCSIVSKYNRKMRPGHSSKISNSSKISADGY